MFVRLALAKPGIEAIIVILMGIGKRDYMKSREGKVHDDEV